MENLYKELEKRNLTRLVEAVNKLRLKDELAEGGPFTIFAPTNEAFEQLEKERGKYFYEEHDLESVIKYHIISQRIFMDEEEYERVKTLEGKKLKIRTEHGPKVNDHPIKEADIQASNGVIHIIDKVLVPELTPESTQSSPLY